MQNKTQTNFYILVTLFSHFFLSNVLANDKLSLCKESKIIGNVFFVATDGNRKGNGSRSKPWPTIQYAASRVPDKSTIIVKPGVYKGQIKISRAFNKGILIKSEIPYLAKLTNNKRVLAIVGDASNFIIEGFEITHINDKTRPLVVHIDGYGRKGLHHITLRNNIIHDSFNNDLLKINNGAEKIKIECNMFYNQGNSDEHIDVNSAKNVVISDNVFFNDFPKSKRKISGKSSSFIVIKDSNGRDDQFLGAENIILMRNIFLNWQGSIGHGFILVGEDGKPYYEAMNISIFNNLLLGNSNKKMRSPFGVKGARQIIFYNNTIVGDLPSNAYAIRINIEENNKPNQDIFFYNNIWSDPYGTMGASINDQNNDFSDTLVLLNHLGTYKLNNNLIWNGNNKLPYSIYDKINSGDDKNLIHLNPKIKDNSDVITPIWLSDKQEFSDGSLTIRETFERIVFYYAMPKNQHAIQNKNDNFHFPKTNILGFKRTPPYSLGAF